MKLDEYRELMSELLQQIPEGKVTTYKALAHAMGIKGYRFVGRLLNTNPYPDDYPCYKVVATDGSLGGFALGFDDKIQRLKEDGIEVKDNQIVSFNEKLYEFCHPERMSFVIPTEAEE